MKKLITCGDSYMSPSLQLPNTHFTEIFAQDCGYELIPYARSGVSNGGIVIQIESAIRDKPDLIIVGTTCPDRVEFAKNNEGSLTEMRPYYIEDLHYLAHDTKEMSEERYTKHNGTIISEPLSTMLHLDDSHVIKLIEKHNNVNFIEKKEALKVYFNNLYHYGWKDQVDRMMVYATMHRLHLSGIPYIFVKDELQMRNEYISHLDYSMPWMTEKEDVSMIFNNMVQGKSTEPIVYHTTVEVQQEVAQYIVKHYNKYFQTH